MKIKMYKLRAAIIITFTNLLISSSVFAQAPQKMSYQAVIRDAGGLLVTSQVIGMEINIRQGSQTGTVVYTETQTPNTNANGLVSIEIGGGAGFDTIHWASNSYFIETKTAVVAPLTTYTITGVSQLLSVPFALYAKTAESVSGVESGAEVNVNADWNALSGDAQILNKPTTIAGYGIIDAVTTTGDQSIAGNKTFTGTISASNQIITNVDTPVNPTDAATKAYVDALKNIIYQEMLDAGLNGIVKDIDGNAYKTIKIGNQVWMAENLKTTKYSTGELIGTTTPDTLDISIEITPKYQWAFNGDEDNVSTYGRLYTWYAVTDSRNVCPTDWHVPTDAEWLTLAIYLNWQDYGNNAGGKLKETGTIHWDSPNTGATNETGFTALPGGYRHYAGPFGNLGTMGSWWSSTESYTGYAYYWSLDYYTINIGQTVFNERLGFSVRCVRDF